MPTELILTRDVPTSEGIWLNRPLLAGERVRERHVQPETLGAEFVACESDNVSRSWFGIPVNAVTPAPMEPAPPPEPEACGNCYFMRNFGGGDACHKKSPRAENFDGIYLAVWPYVKSTGWCGEYQRAEAAK